jgi:uncharacterized protein YutE (UPF0331/DUF86 family)
VTRSGIRERLVSERAAWVREMIAAMRGLPVDDQTRFFEDSRNLAAAESYLRRGLEALLDLGRHVLAKGFGRAALEYKEIAIDLGQVGVLNDAQAALMRDMAGYRNRLVHFYDHVGDQELYEIVRDQVLDIEAVLDGVLRWVAENPDRVDLS